MPKILYLLTGLLLATLWHPADAQKLKYKDIFPLLNAKSWDEGIPQLQTFLSDPKNADHANGMLQMGLYFEDQVNDLDLIADSTAIMKAADSAVFYLAKAKDLITDKELKKNDDYYQSFFRRDLRTGDFGIKLSDVHLDIEKKLQSLRTISEHGKDIFKNLYKTSSLNDFSYKAYSGFTKRYASIQEFYLMAEEGQMDTLQLMMDNEDVLKDAFQDVRRAVSQIGKKGYSPELEFQPIEVYGKDGLTGVDFFQNDVLAWEYGEWAFQVYSEIKEHIGSLKEDLVAFDKQLKAENELLKGLEITPFENITHEIEYSIEDRLKSLEENPLPLTLFTILIKKNEYDFITKSSLNPRIGDEDDVDYQLAITDSLVHIIGEIEKDVALLQDDYITDGKRKYSNLIDGEYGGDFGLIKFRQGYEAFLSKSRDKWLEKNAYFTAKSQWGVSTDGMDSVYLTPNLDSTYALNKSDYFTVATMKDEESNTYVIGVDFKAGGKGFMAMVSNARVIQWKESFELGDFSFNDSTQLISGKFVPAQSGNVCAYLYSSAQVGDKGNFVIANAENVGQIAWSNPLAVKNEPVDVKFNELVKETVLYMITEEDMENMVAGDVAYYVIDRSGKIR